MSFTHYVNIPVNHSSDGEQTNYQMKLNIVKGTGSNTTGTIYLNNHSLNWPYDIEFRNYNGDVLDYWREEYDDTDMTIWIECDSIASSGETDFYLYYGNSGTTDESSGKDTFLFFDDFAAERESWSGDTASMSISGGVCSISGSSSWKTAYGTMRDGAIGKGYELRTRASLPARSSNMGSIIGWRLIENAGIYADFIKFSKAEGMRTSDSNYQFTAVSLNENYHNLWVRRKSSSVVGYIDGSIVATHSNAGAVPDDNMVPYFSIIGSGLTIYVDNVLIRKFVDNEPSWATPGIERELGGSQSPSSNAYFGGLTMF